MTTPTADAVWGIRWEVPVLPDNDPVVPVQPQQPDAPYDDDHMATMSAYNTAITQWYADIVALARAVDEGRLVLDGSADVLATTQALRALPGIGDWTAQYIAMRALRWPDAFPSGDVALQSALNVRADKHPARAAEAASQAWKPWRSYAVIRAWASLTPRTSA